MALNSFFQINLPYGIKRNADGEWFAFNRDYAPLGFNKNENPSENGLFNDLPIHTKYANLTDARLLELAGDEKFVKRDADGKIDTVFLYIDSDHPLKNSKNGVPYFDKLAKLGTIQRKTE